VANEALLQFLLEVNSIEHLYLMGGFAEDALLDGQITRERGDIDLLIPEGRWDATRVDLEERGLRDFAPLLQGPQKEAIALVSCDLGFAVEFWLTEQDAGGNALILPGATAFFRLRMPADTFDFAGATLDGVQVRTVSPRALALLRATSAITRGDDTARAADRRVFQRIVEEFLPGADTEALVPDIEELPGP
jgi:hypothetical protein